MNTNTNYFTSPNTNIYAYDTYQELYRKNETPRLILERTSEDDNMHLAKILLNKNVNLYYQRPIIYLENLQKACEYVRAQNYNSVSFTIKLKNENLIQIGKIGFYYVDKTLKEIGIFYFIGEEYQKKGYASEAACPLIRHLFESLPMTTSLKIDFEYSNIGSRKIAQKICDDIMKYHPNYIMGELNPFVDKYTLKPQSEFLEKDKYFFEGFDRQIEVFYPKGYFNNAKYFEVLSNGYYITKQ